MNVILDTNVFISGIFFSGPPYKILQAWKRGRLQIAFSRDILDEYQRIAKSLASKYPGLDILPIIELITIHGRLINAEGATEKVCVGSIPSWLLSLPEIPLYDKNSIIWNLKGL